MSVTVVIFATLIFCVLLLGSISGIFSERVGIVNIAINGFVVFGAFITCFISFILTDLIFDQSQISMWFQIPITFLAALATGIFALIFGFMTIKLKGNQTVAGFAISLLITGISAFGVYILRTKQGAGILQNYGTTELTLNPSPNSWENLVSWKIFITIIIVVISIFVMQKTRWGLRFKSIGENPQAADVAGINVSRMKWQGVFISGLIAGVAGSIFVQMQWTLFVKSIDVQGLGFMALSIMITSQWKIHYSVFVSMIFAFLYSWSFYGVIEIVEIKRYGALFQAVPYVVTIVALIAFSKRTVSPEALGVPYYKSKR